MGGWIEVVVTPDGSSDDSSLSSPALQSGEASPGPRRTSRQRLLTAIGLLLVGAGLVVLGWVAWQLWGTNWISQRHQAEAVESVRRQWANGQDSAHVDAGVVTAVIRIPRFGKDYEVPVLEGTSDEALASGFGHFSDTARPGRVGNYALAGHRITHGQPLREMPELRPGDKVIVETRRATYTYVLDTPGDGLIVPFTATWVLDPLPTNPDGGVQPDQAPGQRLITLTTCSELFHTDNRMIAFGHLDSVSRRR
ncbi:MAG: class E sortase [Nocardioides sp.]|uniref:class E sortase n=1 Tax=Nocardioides sp. TaxID=35761 RepID=UPI0039E3FC00